MRSKALYDYQIIPIQIDWRFAKKRLDSRADYHVRGVFTD